MLERDRVWVCVCERERERERERLQRIPSHTLIKKVRVFRYKFVGRFVCEREKENVFNLGCDGCH